MSYLLDTNIVIDQIRGDENITSLLKGIAEEGFCLSTVSLAELYHGAYKSDHPTKSRTKVDRWLDIPALKLVSVDREVANEYGKLMSVLQKKGVKLFEMDVLIAATAKVSNLKILTRDRKHFERLKKFGLKVEVV